jgi:hypothetical protein
MESLLVIPSEPELKHELDTLLLESNELLDKQDAVRARIEEIVCLLKARKQCHLDDEILPLAASEAARRQAAKVAKAESV